MESPDCDKRGRGHALRDVDRSAGHLASRARSRQAPPDLGGRCLRYPQRHMLKTILDTLREIVLAFYREPPGC
ncbi:MAG: hypothetical protein JNM38_14675 [Acidobacteria bacterium]|nr:hypothetical protein [Acidobacteriota bacterium]